jgi:hypothetical protein
METKVCPKCGRELPTTSFYPNNRAKDGLNSYCKECSNRVSVECARKRREKKRLEAKENERIEFEKKYKIYTNKELAKFTPRELILELKARGYVGTLLFEEVIVNKHYIDLSKYE